MKGFSVKMEDDQAKELEDYCHKVGKSVSEVIRDFVVSGLHGDPQPVPQPAPQPVPQPTPEPAPQPTPKPEPQPAPQPAPRDPGSGGPAPEFPLALAHRIAALREDMYKLDRYAANARWKYWTPKAPAMLGLLLALFTHNAFVAIGGIAASLLLQIIDAVWRNRVFRHEVAKLGANQLWELILALPDLWEKECQTRSPDLAQAEILAHIKERREHLGELGVKDLGIKF